MGLGLIENGIKLNDRGDNTVDDDLFMHCMAADQSMPSLWFKIYTLNDKDCLSFKEIAIWVKQNVEFI